MKENTGNESSVQNRFTAYLMSAVKHKRMNYMEKKMRIKEYENGSQDSLQKSCTDFQEEYHRYLIERSPWNYDVVPNVDELVKALDETKLIRAILELKNGTRIS